MMSHTSDGKAVMRSISSEGQGETKKKKCASRKKVNSPLCLTMKRSRFHMWFITAQNRISLDKDVIISSPR